MTRTLAHDLTGQRVRYRDGLSRRTGRVVADAGKSLRVTPYDGSEQEIPVKRRMVVEVLSDGVPTTGTIARPFTHERPIDRSKLPQQMTQAAGRGQPKRTGGVSERYRRWVRTLPCAWCGAAPPSEADHHPHRGMGGGKRDDLLVVPLCTVDHAHRTNTRRLGSMTPEDTERWMERRQIELLTAWIRGEIAA